MKKIFLASTAAVALAATLGIGAVRAEEPGEAQNFALRGNIDAALERQAIQQQGSAGFHGHVFGIAPLGYAPGYAHPAYSTSSYPANAAPQY